MLEIAIRNDNVVRGKLFLSARHMQCLTTLEPKVISIAHAFREERRRVERFVERSFHDSYRARITQHYPTLMSVQDGAGRILAAVGFRASSGKRLFLEHYLTRPVEHLLSAAAGTDVDRRGIVEIGGLASAGQGASIFLFVAVAAYLQQQGFTHAVITATKQLHRAFAFMGFEPFELAPADPRRLPDGGRAWGSYYTTDPKVLAGGIGPCFRRLECYLPAENNADLGRLFSRLHYSPDENRVR